MKNMTLLGLINYRSPVSKISYFEIYMQSFDYGHVEVGFRERERVDPFSF